MKYIIRDGNFTGLTIIFFLCAGIGLIYISSEWIENFYIRLVSFSLGLVLVATGGYAGRSRAFGLRPFDSHYEKVRRSYEEEKKKF